MRRAAIMTLFIVGALLQSAALQADARENHKAAIEAIEAERWDDAISLLRAALNERLEERVGAFGRRYLPHHYLGVALAGSGDCRAALESWAESERQAQIYDAGDEAAAQKAGQKRCQDRLQQLESNRQEAESALSGVETISREVAAFRETAELEGLWATGESSFESRQRDGLRRLSEARQTLQAAVEGQDPDAAAQARGIALEAVELLTALKGDAEARLDEVRQAASDSLAGLDSMIERARGALRGVEDLRPYPSQLARRVKTVEDAIAAAEKRKDDVDPDDVERLSRPITVAVAELRRQARRPPADLVAAAEAYLQGRWTDVVESLQDRSFDDRAADRHACLFLAASRHVLWVASGEQDTALGRQAAEGALGCDREAVLPESYFSPEFRRFFARAEEVLTEIAAAEEAAAEEAAAAMEAAESEAAEAEIEDAAPSAAETPDEAPAETPIEEEQDGSEASTEG